MPHAHFCKPSPSGRGVHSSGYPWEGYFGSLNNTFQCSYSEEYHLKQVGRQRSGSFGPIESSLCELNVDRMGPEHLLSLCSWRGPVLTGSEGQYQRKQCGHLPKLFCVLALKSVEMSTRGNRLITLLLCFYRVRARLDLSEFWTFGSRESTLLQAMLS